LGKKGSVERAMSVKVVVFRLEQNERRTK
jgi:hypothetical protein